MIFHHIKIPGFVLSDLYKTSLVLVDKDINNSGSLIRNDEGLPAASETITELPLNINITTRDLPVPAVQKQSKWFLGDNKKHITIVVNDANAVYLGDDSLDFLSSVLAACKLNLADVAIVNINQQKIHYSQLRKELEPSRVLLFGVVTTDIGLPFIVPAYRAQDYDHCAYLQSSSLEIIKQDKMEKSRLWTCLKTLMNV